MDNRLSLLVRWCARPDKLFDFCDEEGPCQKTRVESFSPWPPPLPRPQPTVAPCGVARLNSQTRGVARGQCWGFAHDSKYLRRGARVISAVSQLNDIDHIAFENPDGIQVLVITNMRSEQKVLCQNGKQALELAVEPTCITSLRS